MSSSIYANESGILIATIQQAFCSSDPGEGEAGKNHCDALNPDSPG